MEQNCDCLIEKARSAAIAMVETAVIEELTAESEQLITSHKMCDRNIALSTMRSERLVTASHKMCGR